MPVNRLLLERVIKEEYDRLLNEFVVPMSYSLSKWKKYRKEHNITNAEYHKEHPGTKWKVVHGHKEGDIGEPLKGLSNISYEKATKAHAAIAIRNEATAPPPLGGSGTTATKQQPVPTAKMGQLSQQRAVSGAEFKTAQVTQSQLAAKTDPELTSYERSLILDLENKFRELASIKGIDLVKARSRIAQALQGVYTVFDKEIQASQQQTAEPQATSTTSTTQQQTTTGIK